jgi:hypothetical protein
LRFSNVFPTFSRFSFRGQDGHGQNGQNRLQGVKIRHYNINILFIYSEQNDKSENENDQNDLDHFDHKSKTQLCGIPWKFHVTEGQARCDVGDSFVLQQQRAAGRLQKYKKSSIPLQYGGLFCDKLGD